MTTIAYHHKSKTIAWDSRATSNGVISCDEVQKMKEVKGVKFWLAGSVCDEDLIIDMYFGAKSDVVPESFGLAFDGDNAYLIGSSDDAVFWKQKLEYDKSVGSGGDFALSAMRLGLGAKDAVEHAKTLDVYTGGEVHEIKLD